MAFVFPSHCYMWLRAVFLGMVEHLSVSGELIPCDILHMHMAFTLPIPMSFITFYPSESLSHPSGGVRKWLCDIYCQLGLNHNRSSSV